MKLAILPARGGSKRIKDKNIAPFCGKPMLAYPLAAAARSGLFDEIHVSTDSERIRAVAADLGHPPAFARSPELADDHTPLVPVLASVLEEYARRGREIRDVCLIFPCSPLITEDDLRGAFAVYEKLGRRRTVLAVSEYPVPVEWAFDMEDDGRLTPRQPGKFAVRSQDLKPAYYDAGAFSIFNAEHIRAGTAFTDENFAAYRLPKSKAVDIDGPDDWRLAEALYRAAAS